MDILRGVLTACALGLALVGPAVARPTPGQLERSAAEVAEVERPSTRELRRSAFNVWGLKPAGSLNACFSPLSLYSTLALGESLSGSPTSESFHRFLGLSRDDYRSASLGQDFELRRAARSGLLSYALGVWVHSDVPPAGESASPRDSQGKLGKRPPQRVRQGRPVAPEQRGYSSLVRAVGGEVYAVNFHRPRDVIRHLDNWLMARTGVKLGQPLLASQLERSQLILCGSLVLRSSWWQPFERKRTTAQDFWVSPERAVKLPTMSLSGELPCLLSQTGESNDFSLVELAYAARTGGVQQKLPWALDLIVPDPKLSLDQLEPLLTEERLTDSLTRLRTQPVRLTMPKFHLRSQVSFGPILTRLGLTSPFSAGANFAAVSARPVGAEPLFVDHLIEQVDITVNEGLNSGAPPTRAARSAQPVTLDRPFFFVVRNVKTGHFLILGRYVGLEGSTKP